MAKFVAEKDLDDAICDIIYDAKRYILILSPFIMLDKYFEKLFEKQRSNAEVRIMIGFGKNVDDPTKSFNKSDFEFFKTFPNISVVYIQNLHAKYYANEDNGVITSINLYDYSFVNNIEYGILFESSILGINKEDKKAWEYTIKLLYDNPVVFVRRPNYKKKYLGISKNYLGSDTKLNQTEILVKGGMLRDVKLSSFENENILDTGPDQPRQSREDFLKKQMADPKSKPLKSSTHKLSATALGKKKGKSFKEVQKIMKLYVFLESYRIEK